MQLGRILIATCFVRRLTGEVSSVPCSYRVDVEETDASRHLCNIYAEIIVKQVTIVQPQYLNRQIAFLHDTLYRGCLSLGNAFVTEGEEVDLRRGWGR